MTLSDKEPPILNESELIEFQRIADKAAEKIPHPDDCDCMAQFNRRFKPATCAALVQEVLLLREDLRILTQGRFIQS